MSAYLPGDILLVRNTNANNSLISNLIMAGERARYGDSDYARWTHAALVVSDAGNLVEALSDGIKRTNLSKYASSETLIISPEYADSSRRQFAVSFVLAHVGAAYDTLDFASLALSLLTGWGLSLHGDRPFICSGLVARATECYTNGGYPFPPEQMMPADLGEAYGALSHEKLPPLSFVGRVLDRFRVIMWALSPWHK